MMNPPGFANDTRIASAAIPRAIQSAVPVMASLGAVPRTAPTRSHQGRSIGSSSSESGGGGRRFDSERDGSTEGDLNRVHGAAVSFSTAGRTPAHPSLWESGWVSLRRRRACRWRATSIRSPVSGFEVDRDDPPSPPVTWYVRCSRGGRHSQSVVTRSRSVSADCSASPVHESDLTRSWSRREEARPSRPGRRP